MRWPIWALLVVACGGVPPAAKPPQNVQAQPSSHWVTMPGWNEAFVPRPAIDLSLYLPDFHDELRWPLTQMKHPKLEPSFAIALALASPGVGWLDLCSMGAQNRHTSGDQDLVAYLRGWCSVAKGDVDDACQQLTPLLGSVTRGISDAVRTDLANILAGHGGADEAEHWLNKHNIRDIATLDLLVANYVELGMLDDAKVLDRRISDADSAPTSATRCHRLTRRIVLGGGNDLLAIDELADLATKPKVPDENCVRLHHMVNCWHSPGWACAGFFADQHITLAFAVFDVYTNWPRDQTDYATWLHLGEQVASVAYNDEAAELALSAFEAAKQAHGCNVELSKAVRLLVDKANTARLQPRLKALRAHCIF